MLMKMRNYVEATAIRELKVDEGRIERLRRQHCFCHPNRAGNRGGTELS